MEGYEVLTSDGKSAGHVVAVEGETLIVEHGTLRKRRHALPLAFAHADERESVVRSTLAASMIHDSPAVEDDGVDTAAVAAYYGLAGGYEAPPTEGYGELNPDDPAWTSDQQALADGVEPAEKQRARIREGMSDPDQTYGPAGRPIIPPNPHEVGGREYDERK